MKDHYYNIPLLPDWIAEGRIPATCSVAESVYQHLYLLLITSFGEHRYDDRFGCAVWENDFSQMSSLKWKDLIRESMEESIRLHELRLSSVKVTADIEEFEVMDKKKRYVRKRVGVKVDAFITRTNDPFTFYEKVFIAPLSSE